MSDAFRVSGVSCLAGSSGTAVAAACNSADVDYGLSGCTMPSCMDTTPHQLTPLSAGGCNPACPECVGECPASHPHAYRPSFGFDYCCETADDGTNSFGIGINAGPRADRSDTCATGDTHPCASPPCADYDQNRCLADVTNLTYSYPDNADCTWLLVRSQLASRACRVATY